MNIACILHKYHTYITEYHMYTICIPHVYHTNTTCIPHEYHKYTTLKIITGIPHEYQVSHVDPTHVYTSTRTHACMHNCNRRPA